MKSRSTAPLAASVVGLCAVALAGCGSYATGGAPGYAAVGVEFLAAAVDEAPEEVPRFLRPGVEPAIEPAPPEEPLRRGSRFGVRGGFLMTAPADEGSWGPGLTGGLYYRGGRRTAWELGADYASLDADYGEGRRVSSEIVFLRCDLLFGRRGDAGRKVTTFYLGGVQVGLESATWKATGDTAQRKGGGVNIGAGVGSPSGSWDARVVYSFLIGSDNVTGTIVAAFGYAF